MFFRVGYFMFVQEVETDSAVPFSDYENISTVIDNLDSLVHCDGDALFIFKLFIQSTKGQLK